MDEASLCDRVSLMQDGRLLVTDRPGRDRPRATRVRSSRCAAPTTCSGCSARSARFPHAAAVWPFGESLHYTDARPDAPAGADRAGAGGARRRRPGSTGVTIAPIAAGIEDAFMWYMAQERAA